MSLALARFLLALLTTAIAYRRPALRTTALALAYVACCDIAASSLHGRAASVAWAAFPIAAVWLASPRGAAALAAFPLAVAIAPRGFWPAHPDAYAAVMWLPHLIAPSVIAWALLLKDEGPAGFGLPVRPVSPGSLRAKSARLVGPGDPFLGHHEARLPPAQAVAAIFAASGTADIVAGAGQAGVSAVARALGMPLPDGAPWSLAAPMSWATLAAVALVVARATRRV